MENRIRAMREDRDLTQHQVAASLGITKRKYSYLETGTQAWTDELLVLLADYYHVSVDYLLCQTNNPHRNY